MQPPIIVILTDQHGNEWPIRGQQDVDVAAAALSNQHDGGGDAARVRLVDLARSRGFCLPLSFTDEVELHNCWSGRVAFSSRYSEAVARHLAGMPGGVEALRCRGLKPDGDDQDLRGQTTTFPEAPTPTAAKFSDDRKLLASTQTGRAALARMGYKPHEIATL